MFYKSSNGTFKFQLSNMVSLGPWLCTVGPMFDLVPCIVFLSLLLITAGPMFLWLDCKWDGSHHVCRCIHEPAPCKCKAHVSIIQTADMMVLSSHQVCRPCVSVLEINLRNYSSWAIKYFGPWILDKEAQTMSRKDLIYPPWGYRLCTLWWSSIR